MTQSIKEQDKDLYLFHDNTLVWVLCQETIVTPLIFEKQKKKFKQSVNHHN